jgi:hypothetical protein
MPNTPFKIFDYIPHYYGDVIRILFVVTAGLSFLAIPLWGDILPYGIVFEVFTAILLVVLAGLTSPHSKMVMYVNIIVAALGAFLLELTAISYRSSDSFMLLIVRELGALALVVALYFCVKTARAMSQGTIGEFPRPWEFETPEESKEKE